MSFFDTDLDFLNKVYPPRPATSYAITGNRNGEMDVAGRKHYIWGREIVGVNPPEFHMYDPKKRGGRRTGVKVELAESELAKGSREVVRVALSAPPDVIASTGGQADLRLGGSNVLTVDQHTIKQGLLRQTNPPSMAVVINAFEINEGPTDHKIPDRTSATIAAPGAGLAVWVNYSVDPLDFSIVITEGTPYNKNIPSLGVRPSTPTDKMYFGEARLDDTTTELRDGRNIRPAPPYFKMPSNLITPVSTSITTSGLGAYNMSGLAGATVTLSTADNVAGRVISLKDTGGSADANNITLITEDGSLIDKQPELVIDVSHGNVEVYSDGANWWVRVKPPPAKFTHSPSPLIYRTDRNQARLDIDVYGAFKLAAPGEVLNSGSDIEVEIGASKIVIAAFAGSDAVGTITVTGDIKNRNTGVITPGSEVLLMTGLATDNSTTDVKGNDVHGLSNGLITLNWFVGSTTISTTDVTLTDVDVWACAFYQFNGQSEVTITRQDMTATTTNNSGWILAHMYTVKVSGDEKTSVSIELIATTSAINPTVPDFPYRDARSSLDKPLDGQYEGIFLNVFPGPSTQRYWEIEIMTEYTLTELLEPIDGVILLETGDSVLLETGDKIQLE